MIIEEDVRNTIKIKNIITIVTSVIGALFRRIMSLFKEDKPIYPSYYG